MTHTASMRRTALPSIGFGIDYDVRRWQFGATDDVRVMRDAGVTLVSLSGVTWSLLQPGPDQFDVQWLRDILDRLHENGIAADLATATSRPPAWLAESHPEILAINRDGQASWPAGRQYRRLTSPVLRKYALELVERLAFELGGHPGLAMWRVVDPHDPSDHSDDAAHAFRHWLTQRYHSVDRLNAAWHSSLLDFDEAEPPRGDCGTPQQERDFSRFSSAAVRDHLRAEVGVLKRMSSVPVTATMRVLGCGGLDRLGSVTDVDIVSHDHYVDVARADAWLGLSFAASATRGLSQGAPWISRERARTGGGASARPGQLARDRFTHVAHGADAVLSSQLCGASPEAAREFVALGAALAALPDLAGTPVAPAPVAIMLESESWDASDVALRWYCEFVRRGIPVDVLPMDAATDSYSLVVAPADPSTTGPARATTSLSQRIHDLLDAHGIAGSGVPAGVECRERHGADLSYRIAINHNDHEVRLAEGAATVTIHGDQVTLSNPQRVLPAGGVMVLTMPRVTPRSSSRAPEGAVAG